MFVSGPMELELPRGWNPPLHWSSLSSSCSTR